MPSAIGETIGLDRLLGETVLTQDIARQRLSGQDNLTGNPALWQEGGRARTLDKMPLVWRTISTLQLRGLSIRQIASELRLSDSGVARITRDERYLQYSAQILSEMDQEFLQMKPLAFQALKGGLQALDQDIALRASMQWFKAAGYGGFGAGSSAGGARTSTASAEEVAQRLLAQVNIQINVHPNTGSASITSGASDGSADGAAAADHQGQPAGPQRDRGGTVG